MTSLKQAYHIARRLGLGWSLFRARYELEKRTGLLKRKFPIRPWKQISWNELVREGVSIQENSFFSLRGTRRPHFFFAPDALPAFSSYKSEKLLRFAEKVIKNQFPYFFHNFYDLGAEPDWFLNPLTGQRAASNLHWCDVNFFNPAVGDIKFIWEPSRFAWAYILVRAFAYTESNKYAEKFWELFESWLRANIPNQGPNFACGQECAIRLMAMCFAFFGLARAAATTPERKTNLLKAIAVHAQRIEGNIAFALSTKTNHSLTEAAGLYTAGILFPEFRGAGRWMRLGKRILTREGLSQIYADGAYIQHSMNYHRLMLQDFLWAIRLGQLNEDVFSGPLLQRLRKAVYFLYQMVDGRHGRVPNYGPNDGALVLPLNNCDFLDYRPVVQSCWYLLNRQKLFRPGPWDEDLAWLFAKDTSRAARTELKKRSCSFASGGYYTLHNPQSWSLLRCHSYRHRPAHCDMLHFDLWWEGNNLLRDSGSFMYYCDEPWQSHFPSTAAHNTIVVNNKEQMHRASRFAWLNWTKARLIRKKTFAGGNVQVLQAEHYAYSTKNNRIVPRRSVLCAYDEYWLIVDDVLGEGEGSIKLHWHLPEGARKTGGNRVSLMTSSGPVEIYLWCDNVPIHCNYTCDGKDPAGWQSLYYGHRQPGSAIISSCQAELPVRLVTLVTFEKAAGAIHSEKTGRISWSGEKDGTSYVCGLEPLRSVKDHVFQFVQRGKEKFVLNHN